MDLGSILIILALVLLAAAFIARPLVEHKGVLVTEEDNRLSALQAERDCVLDALQESDMDYTMGKVRAEDYQIQRGVLLARGVEVLKAINRLEVAVGEPAGEVNLEARLESEVARLRRGQGGTSGGFCGACGGPVVEGDHFCSRCGESLLEEEAEA